MATQSVAVCTFVDFQTHTFILTNQYIKVQPNGSPKDLHQ